MDQLGALHAILTHVHALFHLSLIAGLVYGIQDRYRAWSRTRRVLRAIDALGGTPAEGNLFWPAARRARVDDRSVRVVPGLPYPTFTAGWIHSRIHLAQELSDPVTGAESRGSSRDSP